jgi:hypothetical protein
MKNIIFLILIFFTIQKTIKISDKFIINTKKRTSLLIHNRNLLNRKNIVENSPFQYIIQFNKDYKPKTDLKSQLGDKESILENEISIFTTTLEKIRNFNLNSGNIKWVGRFKPHYKFTSKNLENPKKPFDKILPIQKNSFFLTLSNLVKNEEIENLCRKWEKEIKNKDFETKIHNELNIKIIKIELNYKSFKEKNLDPKDFENMYDNYFKFFSEKPETYSIEHSFPIKVNNYYSSGIMQSGLRNITNNVFNFVYRNGITGLNQIVGVTDTGLDYGLN